MNKTIKAMVAGVLLALGASASAATSTDTSAWVYDVTNSPTSGITLAGFNTSLGTLTGVTFTIESQIGGTLYAENTEAQSRVMTVGTGGTVTLSSAGLSFARDAVYSKSFTLGAHDGSIDFGGASGVTDNFTGKSVTVSSPFYSSVDSNWNPSLFTNGGLQFNLSGVALANGPGNAVYMADSTLDARVAVSYTYVAAPVPEAETYAMLLAGLGMMGVISRRKAKKAA